ncbi:hypothetical protein Elgi_38460 [Paenibacillus elgii]|uniref:hypothetical protein n=1 Tax=Paenibacillus elgii TaxID=189691 RepID=UPI002D7C81A8|nr:hypothetical protein Elgi_38460 [Paenibacillus elgii]
MHEIIIVRDPYGCHEAMYVDGNLECDGDTISGEWWEGVIKRYKNFSGVNNRILTDSYMEKYGYYFPVSFRGYCNTDFQLE